MSKILYVNSIDELDYNYVPTYKKCDNGKYLQLCVQKLTTEVIKEKADPTPLILAVDGFAKSVFIELSKKLNVTFIELKIEDDDEKKLVIQKYQKYQNDLL